MDRAKHSVVIVIGEDHHIPRAEDSAESRVEGVGGVEHHGHATRIPGETEEAREGAPTSEGDASGLHGPAVPTPPRGSATPGEECRNRLRHGGGAYGGRGGVIHVGQGASFLLAGTGSSPPDPWNRGNLHGCRGGRGGKIGRETRPEQANRESCGAFQGPAPPSWPLPHRRPGPPPVPSPDVVGRAEGSPLRSRVPWRGKRETGDLSERRR
jgi:hypothetical protein